MMQPARHRRAPHVTHRKVHQYEQHRHRGYQPLFELRRLMVGQLVRCRGGRGTLRALQACAVSGVFHRADDVRRSGGTVHAHRICEQAHRARGNARHGGDRLFHPRGARRAAHACNRVLRHGIAFLLWCIAVQVISSASAKAPSARPQRSRPPRGCRARRSCGGARSKARG